MGFAARSIPSPRPSPSSSAILPTGMRRPGREYGGDTDTVASMALALVGADCGTYRLPEASSGRARLTSRDRVASVLPTVFAPRSVCRDSASLARRRPDRSSSIVRRPDRMVGFYSSRGGKSRRGAWYNPSRMGICASLSPRSLPARRYAGGVRVVRLGNGVDHAPLLSLALGSASDRVVRLAAPRPASAAVGDNIMAGSGPMASAGIGVNSDDVPPAQCPEAETPADRSAYGWIPLTRQISGYGLGRVVRVGWRRNSHARRRVLRQ